MTSYQGELVTGHKSGIINNLVSRIYNNLFGEMLTSAWQCNGDKLGSEMHWLDPPLNSPLIPTIHFLDQEPGEALNP